MTGVEREGAPQRQERLAVFGQIGLAPRHQLAADSDYSRERWETPVRDLHRTRGGVMGIDARMFVRLRRSSPLSEQEIRQTAARMAATLGHRHFLIRRESSYRGPRHALSLVETVGELRADGYDLEETQWLGLPSDRQVWTQDGDDIVAEPGEQMIEVNLWTRYYGEGYERGDWLTIRATAEFLEHVLPDCEVWYGGDSSGICAERFDTAARSRLHAHFLDHGHEPYRSFFGRGQPAETCEFCAARPMADVGGGRGSTFWSCNGCGLKRITVGGRAYDLAQDQDFFEWEVPAPRGSDA